MFYKNFVKHWLDILLSLILLFGLSWLMFLIVMIYVFAMEFPIFFTQKRIGKNNTPFVLIKFRTLTVGDKVEGVENRFVLGRFLRFTSLDELPQLWNVLRGEMSFIGPRPLPVEYLPLYSKEQLKRHEVKPGITGWAQINGRNSISWQQKFELDSYYVNHLSFVLDLRIAIRTLLLLLSFKKDVSLEEQKFTGN